MWGNSKYLVVFCLNNEVAEPFLNTTQLSGNICLVFPILFNPHLLSIKSIPVFVSFVLVCTALGWKLNFPSVTGGTPAKFCFFVVFFFFPFILPVNSQVESIAVAWRKFVKWIYVVHMNDKNKRIRNKLWSPTTSPQNLPTPPPPNKN